MLSSFARFARIAAIAVVAVFAAADMAEARAGRGGSFGSRGMRTFSAPPVTNTAPRPAQPIERSMTQPGQVTPGITAPRPGATAQAAPQRRFGTGFLAGLLGAGLLGALFGVGFFGGLGGLGSIFGLLMQLALIGGLVWLAMSFFRRREQPAFAGAGAGQAQGAARSSLPGLGSLGGGLGGLAGGMAAGGAPATEEVVLSAADFDAFEQALYDVQKAFSDEDIAALRRLTTPEMVSFLSEDLAENAKAGVVNRLSDTKLLQGDLAEAWREGDDEYATVAMRFSLIDYKVDRASGALVEGSTSEPVEATELWTFRRSRGGPWLLSAIQQA